MTDNDFTLWDRGDGANREFAIVEFADGRFAMVKQDGIKADIFDVTPTLDTSVFASGDVMCATVEIPNASSANGGTVLLHSVAILDKDDQAGALDLVFLRSNKSLGTPNSAVSISDADAVEILGIISVLETDYIDLVGSQLVTKPLIGLALDTASAATSLFVSLISRSAKTYTASGLVIKLGIVRD